MTHDQIIKRIDFLEDEVEKIEDRIKKVISNPQTLRYRQRDIKRYKKEISELYGILKPKQSNPI